MQASISGEKQPKSGEQSNERNILSDEGNEDRNRETVSHLHRPCFDVAFTSPVSQHLRCDYRPPSQIVYRISKKDPNQIMFSYLLNDNWTIKKSLYVYIYSGFLFKKL